MNRRELLLAGGTVIASSFLFGFELRAQTGPKREDIRTFSSSPDKVAALRRAFQELRGRPLEAPVGWFNYAAVHKVSPMDPLTRGLEPTLGAYWNQCHRDEQLFFLWHRAYLRAFELNLQRLANDATLRLPYWDWHADSALPEIFRSETLAGGERNWLFNEKRSADAHNGRPLLGGSSGAIDKGDFSRFQSLLNGSEHSDIHIGVGRGGGDMSKQSTAARDPIFWLHHCNIDRLLAAWVDRTTRTIPDQGSAWQAGRYKFPIDGAADFSPPAGDLAPASTMPFGQAYESLSAPFVQTPRQPVTRPPVRARAGVAPRRMTETLFALNAPVALAVPAQGASIALSVGERPRLNLERFMREAAPAAAPNAPPRTVRIVLEGVQLADPPGNLLGYDVYLNLPEGTGLPDADRKIGAIGFFTLSDDAHAEHGGMPGGGTTLTFDAPAMPGRQEPLSQILTVSLVPRFIGGGDGAAGQSGILVAEVRAEVSGDALR
jgi:tyrosinase